MSSVSRPGRIRFRGRKRGPARPMLMQIGDGGLGGVFRVGDDVLEAGGQRGFKGGFKARRSLERVGDDGEVAAQAAVLFGSKTALTPAK